MNYQLVRVALWLIPAVLSLAWLAPQPARAAHARCPTPGVQSPVITAHPTERRRMALTFDADAFHAGTSDILDALQRYDAHATFFLTGTWMRAHPEFVQRMLTEGHQVVTHGNVHVDFRNLSDAQIRANLATAEAELADLGGAGWPYIRLPSDAFDGRVLRTLCQQGYSYIFWALDARDAVGEPKSAAYVYNRLVNHLSGDNGQGAVVLLHLGKPGTTAALPRALDYFDGQGYRFMTIHDLLHTPDHVPRARPFNPATCHTMDLVFCNAQ
jgi:peptidoglycan-N-acetylmuramic acid deacetylase